MSDFSQCGLALWFLLYGIIVTLQTIMKLYRIAKHRYEIGIGEKGLAVLKTGCLASQSGSWTSRLLGQMKFKADSALFGNEKDGSFKSALGAVYQSFGGKDLYPSAQEKAAKIGF